MAKPPTVYPPEFRQKIPELICSEKPETPSPDGST